jgi:hypothetical protein
MQEPTTALQHGNLVSQNTMYSAGKNKNKYLKEQIPPKKHFVGPSRGISIPL